MKAGLTMLAALILAALPASGAGAWEAAERIESYAVSGSSAIELYRSIGENGPKAGAGRAIAFTTYELLWSRDYRPEAGGCTLKSARPHLTIIYRLPRPSAKLAAPLEALWARFIAGIDKHERVHGDIILDAVRRIEAATVGLRVEGDAGCKAIRAEVQKHVAAAAADMRARNRDFDKREMSDGGNVHKLILALVNGG